MSGDLPKEVIRRYVRRHLERISYCYESQLLGAPGLAGTVMAVFRIDGASGTVVSATASGLSEPVARCVAEVIEAISFPASPSRGGLTQVNYPFEFRPAGR